MSRCASECVLVRELKEDLCVSVGGGWGGGCGCFEQGRGEGSEAALQRDG